MSVPLGGDGSPPCTLISCNDFLWGVEGAATWTTPAAKSKFRATVRCAELTLEGPSECLDSRKALLLSGSSSKSAADKSRIREWSFCRRTRTRQLNIALRHQTQRSLNSTPSRKNLLYCKAPNQNDLRTLLVTSGKRTGKRSQNIHDTIQDCSGHDVNVCCCFFRPALR